MINKKIDEITEEDLQSLIDNSVLERKTIEYKQALPGKSDSDKKKFLGDVSSFANASGGNLICGIVEDRKTGLPKALEGLDLQNVDQEIRTLDEMIRYGIQPRISGIVIQPIKLANSKTVLIINIPKSWNMPHRVIFKGHDKFYSRSTNGKYQLDVSELRIAFNLSNTIAERIRSFRENRISKIIADDTPIHFVKTPKIVLHLIPIISFNPGQSYDLMKIYYDYSKMPPIYDSGFDYKYNFDGLLTYCETQEEKCISSTLLFKNGIIEALEGRLISVNGERLLIPGILYEKEIISSLIDYLDVFKILNVELPIFIFLTLMGVRGYSMSAERSITLSYQRHPIDRDILLLPEVVLESYNTDPADVLRPCFDSIWNACGYHKSLNYDDNNKWNPK